MRKVVQLTEMIERHTKEYPGNRIHLWINTLCVPLRDTSTPRASQDIELTLLGAENTHRRKAIRKMLDVFQNAKRVLVVSPVFTEAGSDPLERMARLAVSVWQTRLWTFQEAYFSLASLELYIQFSAKPVSLMDILISGNAAEFGDNVPSSKVSRSFVNVLINTVNTQARRKGARLSMRELIGPLSQRTTSNAEDEAVCIAALLGIDSEGLLRRRSAAERMEWLLRQNIETSPSLLFVPGPRLEAQDLRWAPRSLLQSREFGVPTMISMNKTLPGGENSARLSAKGLLVKLTSWRVCPPRNPPASVGMVATD
jgi:hypothetical protein